MNVIEYIFGPKCSVFRTSVVHKSIFEWRNSANRHWEWYRSRSRRLLLVKLSKAAPAWSTNRDVWRLSHNVIGAISSAMNELLDTHAALVGEWQEFVSCAKNVLYDISQPKFLKIQNLTFWKICVLRRSTVARKGLLKAPCPRGSHFGGKKLFFPRIFWEIFK